MNARHLSAYILQALARAQSDGRESNLETLVDELKVRRKDVRAALTALHREGMVDVLRMRLTLSGFAIGRALLDQKLPVLRKPAQSAIVAA